MPLQNVQRGANTVDAAITAGVNVTSGAAHTKGATWTQLVASTAESSAGLILYVGNSDVSAADSSSLLDIAIGAASSERVLIANIGVGGSERSSALLFPVAIPKGSRISAKLQSVTASKVIAFAALSLPEAGLTDAAQTVDTYGANTATSKGVVLTTLTTVNVRTAWQEVAASTTRAARFITWSLAGPNNAVSVSSTGFFDIGFGAAGVEKPVVMNVPYQTASTEAVGYGRYYLPCAIPAGSRLVVRHVAGVVSATAPPSILVHLIG